MAVAVVAPLAAAWWQLASSWRLRLNPALQEMLNRAASFSTEHPIVAEPGAKFEASVHAWHAGINDLQKGFRADFAALESEVSPASTVAAVVGGTAGLLYLLMFWPDASVFLSDSTKKALRLPLNAVNYARGGLAFVALHQGWLLADVLSTAFDIATAMESHVKEMKKQAPDLAARGMNMAAQVDLQRDNSRRWGVKLHGFTIDTLFWMEFRINLAVGIAMAWVAAWYCWGQIQAKREEMGMRKTTLRDKYNVRALARLRRRNREMEHEQETAGEREQGLRSTVDELTRLRSTARITFEQLQFDTGPTGGHLGGGSFGEVYKAVWSGGGGVQVAVKKIRFSTVAQAEVDLLLNLRHASIVACYGQSTQPGSSGEVPQMCIITEYCKYGSLQSLMHSYRGPRSLTWPPLRPPEKQAEWLGWMKQIAQGMVYLHQCNVLHRDLKPGNVLIDNNKKLKICDFGLSKLADGATEQHTADAGTYQYLAPEVFEAQAGYGTACDVYSFGVLINEMAAHEIPWAHVDLPPVFHPQFLLFLIQKHRKCEFSPCISFLLKRGETSVQGPKKFDVEARVINGDRPNLAADITPEFEALVQVHFLLKNLDFLLKNLDFLLKNLDLCTNRRPAGPRAP